MTKKQKGSLKLLLLSGVITVLVGVVIYYFSTPEKSAESHISPMADDLAVIELGESVYAQNCASCHGADLEGQANWKQRESNGYLPAPPHDETGHTWHHSDEYLFYITKYGIEELIGKKYPNNMPAYKDQLTDDEIIAVLSYIKSVWPERIQKQHDSINARQNNTR